jgi:hypothetical protein
MNQLDITFLVLAPEVEKLAPENLKPGLFRKHRTRHSPDGRLLGTKMRTDAQIIQDFWKRVKKGQPDECWEWQAARNSQVKGRDYGVMWAGSRRWKTHVFSWVLHFGPTHGLWVCHHCDNPPCCNPVHLFLGTCKDNVADMLQKGRSNRECGEDRYNARLTEDNIREIRRRYKRRSTGPDNGASLAQEFGIVKSMIDSIVKYRRWKHVQ